MNISHDLPDDATQIGIIAIGRIANTTFSDTAEKMPFLSRMIRIQQSHSEETTSHSGIEISIARGSEQHFQAVKARCGSVQFHEEINSAVTGLNLLVIYVDIVELSKDDCLHAAANAVRLSGVSSIAVVIAAAENDGDRAELSKSPVYRAICQSNSACISIYEAQQTSLEIFVQIYRSIALPAASRAGWVGVDLEDVMSVFATHGSGSHYGIGSATGNNSEQIALHLALQNLPQENNPLTETASILVTIEGRSNLMNLAHICSIMTKVRLSSPNAHIICGAYSTDDLDSDFRVTLIRTTTERQGLLAVG